MHILITGAAGMIGRKLTARLVRDGVLNGRAIDRMTLTDIVAPELPAGATFAVATAASDLATAGAAARAIAGRPDVIFHLAAIVSGEAEADFEKGYGVNFGGTRELLEAIRLAGDGYRPKLVFASSIAVFGAPFPDAIGDEFFLTPLTSYGTQKAIGELLLADYTRRGFLDGIGIRLPTIVVRPGKPNKAAWGFSSTRPTSQATRSAPASISPCRACAVRSARRSRRSRASLAPTSRGASAASRTQRSRKSSPAGRRISTHAAQRRWAFAPRRRSMTSCARISRMSSAGGLGEGRVGKVACRGLRYRALAWRDFAHAVKRRGSDSVGKGAGGAAQVA